MLENLEFLDSVKVSRGSIEDLLQGKLCGDFMNLNIEDDSIDVRVHYDNNEDFKHEILNILGLDITDIEEYKETVLDTESSCTSIFDFYVSFAMGDMKKFLSKNIGKNITGEFYSDESTEKIIFVIDNENK